MVLDLVMSFARYRARDLLLNVNIHKRCFTKWFIKVWSDSESSSASSSMFSWFFSTIFTFSKITLTCSSFSFRFFTQHCYSYRGLHLLKQDQSTNKMCICKNIIEIIFIFTNNSFPKVWSGLEGLASLDNFWMCLDRYMHGWA